jgi:effector-binding domain-containing protein
VTEEQPYEVVRVERDFEIRRYPEHVVAQVRVPGSFESAGNTAFRPLVNYISGRNVTGTGLAMTAPVVQEPIANAHLVSFVLPSGVNAGNAPIPTDPSVQVHVMPVEYAAVTRFSGRWSESSYAERVRELTKSVQAAGLEILGPARFARFNPPWTPWFMRRNEVLLPVARPDAS